MHWIIHSNQDIILNGLLQSYWNEANRGLAQSGSAHRSGR